jgi:serine/threonine-protein kinase
VHISPDGRHVVMDIYDNGRTDVWVYEEARENLSRVTNGPGDAEHPLWTPDGLRIVFSHREKSAINLFWRRADGTGEVQRLTTAGGSQFAASWHPSGGFLALWERTPQNDDDLLILPVEGSDNTKWTPGKPTVFLSTPFAEREPMFSPDGRWIAYNSNETGSDEIYVRPFPGPGGKWKVSTGGGETPTWSRVRRELLYAAPDRRIMAVPYSVQGESFIAEKPQSWGDLRFVPRKRSGPTRSYDLHPDGNRIALALAPQTGTEVKQDRVVLVFNFFDELRRIAPVTRR